MPAVCLNHLKNKEEAMLTDFRQSDVPGCFEGKFDFKLFNTQTDVFIDMEEPDKDYINKCIDNLNSLSDELIDELCVYIIKYCNDFREYFEDEGIEIPEDISGRAILEYIEPVVLGIEDPDDSDIAGYSLEFNVPWEEEHGMEVVIMDNKIMYVSTYNGMGAWCEDYDDGCNYVLGANLT